MSKPESHGKFIETDVLIIGGGIAGLWAANRARAFSERVLVVEKGPGSYGGQASSAGGDMIVVFPEDDIRAFMDDLVYYYEGLCEQDLMKMIFLKTSERFQDYVDMGHSFARNADGGLKGVPQRGLKNIRLYLSRPFGEGGLNMVKHVTRRVQGLGVQRLNKVMITDLIKDGPAVVGAVGFDILSGAYYIIKAGAVILTTGVSGWKASYMKSGATGEGILMAMRAGAQARNFEFLKVWNMPRQFSWEGQTSLLPLGAKFVNAKGEYFMEKYSPTLGFNTDPHYIVRGMSIEYLEGRGPFYLDCSGMTPESVELMTPTVGWASLNYQKLMSIGMSFFEQKLEWMPQLNEPLGGIVADENGSTGIPGLFAAGTARNLDTGVYIGGLHLATTAVTGFIAGESAAKYAGENPGHGVSLEQAEDLKRRLFAPLGQTGIPYKEVLREVQEAFFPFDVCILKNEKSLERALGRLEKVKHELFPKMAAKDPHYLSKLIEIQALTRLTELILRSSLLRTESRAGHFRADYPKRNNAEWLCWNLARLDAQDEFQFSKMPLPLERYEIQPSRYYSENFDFPDVSHLL